MNAPSLLRWFPVLAPLFLVCAASGEQPIDFARDIRPILSEHCFRCHGPDAANREAELRLDQKEQALGVVNERRIVAPGDREASELWRRIVSDDPDALMPPPDAHKPLSEAQRSKLGQWIDAGAPWREHWSFQPPQRAEVPEGQEAIDFFVERRMRDRGLRFAPQADPVTLVRRLHLDLWGLPPTPQRVDRFVASYRNDSDKAYAELVDELLAGPHYGERMALMWLDAARYGDTSVMHADGGRTMWPWRDWVVNAFNTNQPFDQFSIEQLAGDLLENPTTDQLIATGFNRNHATSDEGGAIAEELRVSYVVDRVQTTANVWMGLTMECAQCHDHKYDPITQREYYAFYAFFNDHVDPGMQTRNGNQAPVVTVPDPAHDARVEAAEKDRAKKIDSLEAAIRAAKPAADAVSAWRNKRLTALQQPHALDQPPSPLRPSPPSGATEAPRLTRWIPLTESKGDALLDHVGGGVLAKIRGGRQRLPWRGKQTGLKLGTRRRVLDGASSLHCRQRRFSPCHSGCGPRAPAPLRSCRAWTRTRDSEGWISECMRAARRCDGSNAGPNTRCTWSVAKRSRPINGGTLRSRTTEVRATAAS